MVDLGKDYQEVKRYLGVLTLEAKYVLVTVLPWLRLFLNFLSRYHHLLCHHQCYRVFFVVANKSSNLMEVLLLEVEEGHVLLQAMALICNWTH